MSCFIHKWSKWYPYEYAWGSNQLKVCKECGAHKSAEFGGYMTQCIRIEDLRKIKELAMKENKENL